MTPEQITALGTLVAAVGALLIAWRNSRKTDDAKDKALVAATKAEIAAAEAVASRAEIVATKEGVFEVGRQLDGRLTELLEVTKRAAKAEGVIEGRRLQSENDAKGKAKG